ncbi:hypothetical protein B0H10DRAFT_2189171 [Mycena sp. CBHHK59/15]|nr:hypothetical protein B0H10DRAFT_2189171 [Mycena sp. CBHHK59/15]
MYSQRDNFGHEGNWHSPMANIHRNGAFLSTGIDPSPVGREISFSRSTRPYQELSLFGPGYPRSFRPTGAIPSSNGYLVHDWDIPQYQRPSSVGLFEPLESSTFSHMLLQDFQTAGQGHAARAELRVNMGPDYNQDDHTVLGLGFPPSSMSLFEADLEKELQRNHVIGRREPWTLVCNRVTVYMMSQI